MTTAEELLARHAPQQQAETPQQDPAESLLKRSTRRAGQELLSSVSAPAAMYGMARAGIESAFNDDVSFQDAMFSEDGRQMIRRAVEGDRAAALLLQENSTDYLRPGLSWAADVYNTTGDWMGVQYNEDGSVPLDEEVGGIALSTLLTLPASLVTKPIALTNKITNKALRTTTRGAIRAAEMALPGTVMGKTVGGTAANMGANNAVQLAINDAARTLMDEPTLSGTVLPVDEEYTAGSVTPEYGNGLPQPDAVMSAGEVAAEAEQGDGPGLLEAGGKAVATGGALAIGTMAAVRGGRGIGRALGISDPPLPNTNPRPGDVELSELPSNNPVEAVTEGGTTALLDESNVLVEGVRRTLGDSAAETFDDFLRSNTGSALTAAYDRFYNMGVMLRDGSVKAPPLRMIRQNYRKMDRSTRSQFDDTMTGLDELNNRERGINTMPNVETSVIRAKVDRGLRNDSVKQLVEQYDRVTRAFTESRYKEEIIDLDQFGREMNRAFNAKTGRGGYVPIRREHQQNKSTKLRNALFGSPGNDNLRAGVLSSEELRRMGGNIKREKPLDALENYARENIGELHTHAVRRRFLKSVNNAPVRAFKEPVKVVTRGSKGKGTKMTVREGGQDVEYMVGDPRIARALQFRPHAVVAGANMIRKLFQAGTTGAANPFFAPISLIYDATFGMLTASNRHMVTGVLDQALANRLATTGMSPEAQIRVRQALAGVVRPAELTFTVLEGMFEGVSGRVKEWHAVNMAQKAAQSGNPMDQRAAMEAADRFMKSKYGVMHMNGYAANNHLNDISEATNVLERKLNYMRNSKGLRFYSHLLGTLREAYRMGMYSRNWANEAGTLQRQIADNVRKAGRRGLTPDDIKKIEVDTSRKHASRIAKHVRNAASDPSKRGQSETLNRMTSTLPYANVIMHSTAHLIASMKNPATWSVIGTLAVFKASMIENMSPEAREYIDNRVPDYKRISHMPIEQDREAGEAFDPEKHIEWIPLGPELGTVAHMFQSIFTGMTRQAEEDNMAPGLSEELLKAASELFLGYAAPPALNMITAAAGLGTLDPGAALEGRELFRQGFKDGGLNEKRGTGLNSGVVYDRAYDIVASALGTLGRTIMESAEALDSQMHRYDSGFLEGMDEVFDVVLYNAVQRQTVGTLFGDAVTQRPMGTPLADRTYEINSQMERIVDLHRAVVPNLTDLADADIPWSEAINNMPETLRDTPLQIEAQLVARYFGSAFHGPIMDEIGQMRKRFRRVQGDREHPVVVRNTLLNQLNTQMHDKYDNVVENYGQFEQQMIAHTGNPDWSLDDFVERAEEILQ